MSDNLSPSVALTREQQKQRLTAAAQVLQEGEMTQAEIAEKHGVTPSAVSKWKSTLEEDGIAGLQSTNEEGNQGPDSQLDDQDREQLDELLEEGALTHGWETDLWTAPRVAALIEQEFEIDFTQRHCSQIPASLATVPSNRVKPPLRKIQKRSSAGSTKKPNSSKKADRRREILCIDEPPYRYVPVTTQRWAKEGSYLEISPVQSDWRKISAIGAVAL